MHLESKSAVVLCTPCTWEKTISQSRAASNNHRFLVIMYKMGSLPLPEFNILRATILSHEMVTLLCLIKWEQNLNSNKNIYSFPMSYTIFRFVAHKHSYRGGGGGGGRGHPPPPPCGRQHLKIETIPLISCIHAINHWRSCLVPSSKANLAAVPIFLSNARMQFTNTLPGLMALCKNIKWLISNCSWFYEVNFLE
jgi:hypothetical protein